jgi:hypothetical protein
MISREALNEVKSICAKLGRELSDVEAHSVGERVIRFLLAIEDFDPPNLNYKEQSVLNHIRKLKESENRSPSIREITECIGLSSSRSGHRVVEQLTMRGLIARDENGSLVALE